MIAHPVGNDICIILYGGSVPHIGTVTLSSEQEGSETFAFGKHKEGVITELVSDLLRNTLRGNVMVCGGIHLDNITTQEIEDVKELCRLMTLELSTKLEKKVNRIAVEEAAMNIVVGITGASGSIYAVRLLEVLKNLNYVNTHLIVSEWARKNIEIETDCTPEYVESLATEVYDNRNLGGKISSGSFLTDGMVVLPCSMKTLSSIAYGYCDNLISRSADVMIKEGRNLILCPRETPLSAIHLENMLKLSRLGVKIVPPMPAFYINPSTISDLVDASVMRILDQLGIKHTIAPRWNG